MLSAHIHVTVHDSRDIESKRQASAVTARILLAIVELMGDIRRGLRRQFGNRAWRFPGYNQRGQFE